MEKGLERQLFEFYSREGMSPVDIVIEAFRFKFSVNIDKLQSFSFQDYNDVVVEYNDSAYKMYNDICSRDAEYILEMEKKFEKIYTADFMQELYYEIEDNLYQCKTIEEKELYIYSILSPFNNIIITCFPSPIEELYISPVWGDIEIEMEIKSKWVDHFIAYKLHTGLNDVKDCVFWEPFKGWRVAALNFINIVGKIVEFQGLDISKIQKKYCLLGGYKFSTIKEGLIYRNLPEIYGNDSRSLALPIQLDTEEAKSLFGKIKYCVKDGDLYKWNGSPSLFGYFVDKTSDILNVRQSNNRLPWKIYKEAFQCSEKDISTARQAVNGYKNKMLSEPDGFLDIKNACR